jgi:hypothetical protein
VRRCAKDAKSTEHNTVVPHNTARQEVSDYNMPNDAAEMDTNLPRVGVNSDFDISNRLAITVAGGPGKETFFSGYESEGDVTARHHCSLIGV